LKPSSAAKPSCARKTTLDARTEEIQLTFTINHLMKASNRTRWAWLVATFFGIGDLKPGPGTWASAATVLLWWLLATKVLASQQWIACIVLSVLVTAIGIRASTIVANESEAHDPGFVVIDEVAGQLIAMIAVPAVWKYLLLSLILFRAFDITKPPPLRRLERLPEGTGIMLDDVGAGIYSLILMQVAVHLKVLG
jgi:phosphatidylglycerophosphatase A